MSLGPYRDRQTQFNNWMVTEGTWKVTDSDGGGAVCRARFSGALWHRYPRVLLQMQADPLTAETMREGSFAPPSGVRIHVLNAFTFPDSSAGSVEW